MVMKKISLNCNYCVSGTCKCHFECIMILNNHNKILKIMIFFFFWGGGGRILVVFFFCFFFLSFFFVQTVLTRTICYSSVDFQCFCCTVCDKLNAQVCQEVHVSHLHFYSKTVAKLKPIIRQYPD